MRPMSRAIAAFILVLPCLATLTAHAQATPTASQRFRLSTFGTATETYTGLNSSRNGGITAGIDLGVHSFRSIQTSIELRGTYPIGQAQIDNQKNLLGGLKEAKAFGRFSPYVDILFGRGEIDYPTGFATPSGKFYYVESLSNVIATGGGLDLQVSDRLFLKADAQLQRYSTPVTDSGHLYSKPFSVGLSYRFVFRHAFP